MSDHIEQQTAFARHLRNSGKHAAPAGIEDRRLQIYRDLIYRNIEGFIRSAFPVMHRLFDEQAWHDMIRDFIDRHRSETPYFVEVSREFIDYLESERSVDSDPGFLVELARYEWAELALFVADEVLPPNPPVIVAELPQARLSVSPLAWPMVFSYPVHEIGVGNQPDEPAPQPVCLVVYRNRSQRVRFLEINPVTARLLEICETQPGRTGQALLEQIVAEMQHHDADAVFKGGIDTLAQLHGLDIILHIDPA